MGLERESGIVAAKGYAAGHDAAIVGEVALDCQEQELKIGSNESSRGCALKWTHLAAFYIRPDYLPD